MSFWAQDRDLRPRPAHRARRDAFGHLPVDLGLLAIAAQAAGQQRRVRLQKRLGEEIDRHHLTVSALPTGVLEPVRLQQRLPAVFRHRPQRRRRVRQRG